MFDGGALRAQAPCVGWRSNVPVARLMEVNGHSNSLLILIRSNPDVLRVPAELLAEIPTLRQRLAKLVQVLAAGRREQRAG